MTDERVLKTTGHYESYGVQDFSLRYATALSYELTADLLEERCGCKCSSDQHIYNLVAQKAEKIGETQAALIKQYEPCFSRLEAAKVDIYDAQSVENIWLTDGVCVSEQKKQRNKIAKSGKERTITDVTLMQCPDGHYKTLIAAQGIDSVALAKAELCQAFGDKVCQIPAVVISDGARCIKNEVKSIFGQDVTHILDYFHVQDKVCQLMSMIASNKKDKELSIQFLLNALWKGQTNQAIEHLNALKPKNALKREELVKYLTKNQDYIIDYERRKATGKIIGSGRGEKQNDIIVAKRQKQKSMAWSANGSKNLALVTAHFYNIAA
jgi:hypothetical protein